jgi:hypothetical protein
MKKVYSLILSFSLLMGFSTIGNAQSLTVQGSAFLTTDSIGFAYESPSYDPTDWIGIYKVGETPGGGTSSTVWDYIPSASGQVKLKAPPEGGRYIAFLCCCDGYNVLATSAEFDVYAPVLTSSLYTYLQGDPILFNYVSPKWTSTDWIGIYPANTLPGSGNPAIDWKYLPDSAGTMTFNTNLDPGLYNAYLLCCDGYSILASCEFEVKNPNVAYIIPKADKFAAGAPIELIYNDPLYAAEDWVGIYAEGDDPALVSSAAWTYLTAKSGTVSLPGTLSGGNYFAVIFCCNATETEYARSKVFTVEAGASGTYIKTAASVYPEGVDILVNYRDADYQDKDWIGVYNKGEAPGGPASIMWQYIPADSGTVSFTNTLAIGDYTVFLLCCDGYNIKARYNFKVAGGSEPYIVASDISYSEGDSLVFHYNSPAWVATDWIGIYHPGDKPGEQYSITWQYIPVTKGTMVFHYPDDHDLVPGEYWAGLFCCDGYDLYAQTSFSVKEGSTGMADIKVAATVNIFPNPNGGIFHVSVTGGETIRQVKVLNLAGNVLYQDLPDGSADRKTLNLSHLSKGVYLVEVLTDHNRVNRKLVIQ